MERLRLAVKKDGALQFLSHLDFARAVRYDIIRAGLPICYSEGFNPHMKLSFASALGVGVCADVEYLDMELSEKLPVEDVMKRMNEKAPNGFLVLDGKYIDQRAAKLMAAANYAIYDLKGPLAGELTQEELDKILAAFNRAENVQYEKISPKKGKKPRTIEVKHHVIEPVRGSCENGQLTLRAGILETDEGAIKPQQLWDVLASQFGLPVTPDLMLARRRAVYNRHDGHNDSLFDVV